MVARPTETPNLKLPLRANGIQAFKNSFRAAMNKLDTLLAGLGDGVLNATDITYSADDSNSTQADRSVSAELDALRARVTRLEGRSDSNSQG